MSQGIDIYTQVGLTKIRDAAGTGSQVRIAHLALGDGAGGSYAPQASQTQLRRERLRVAIERQYPLGDDSWHVSARVPVGVAEITVRELGWIDEDGDLIALWAGTDVDDARRTGTVELLLSETLVFTGLADGVVTVTAPIDDYLDHAVLALTTDALLLDRHLSLANSLRTYA